MEEFSCTCDSVGSVPTVTVSAPPLPSKSSTTDILTIDATVLVLLCVGSALCAAVVALMSKPKFKLNAIFQAWLENNWINFSFLFFESSDRLPSSWKARMVLTTWLLTALLITVEVGSYLKSSFATTTYDLIDRYQDALKYDDVIFGAISFSPAESFRCSEDEMAKHNEACRQLANSMAYIKDLFWISENTREHPEQRNVLLLTLTDLKRFVRETIQEIRESGRLFYVGQSSVDSYLYMLVKEEFRKNLFVTEQLIQCALLITEKKPWAYKELEGNYLLEIILWKKPSEEGTELYLEDCLVVFNLWLIGMVISCAIFLLEVCSYFALRRCQAKITTRKISNKIEFPH